MSVVKLLSRIIAPTENELTAEELAEDRDRHLLLHDHTYGISTFRSVQTKDFLAENTHTHTESHMLFHPFCNRSFRPVDAIRLCLFGLDS